MTTYESASVSSYTDTAVCQSSKLLKTDTKNYMTFNNHNHLIIHSRDPFGRNTSLSYLNAISVSSPYWKAARRESIFNVVNKDGIMVNIVDLAPSQQGTKKKK